MRVPRLVAVVLWLMVAFLAVAGFAAFSPQSAPETTTPDTSTTLPARGSATGQVLARALAAGMRSTPQLETSSVYAQEEEEVVLDSLRLERYLDPPPPTTTTAPPVRTTSQPVAVPTAKTFMSSDEVRSIIALFFKPEDVDTALSIAKCESTLNPNNVNGSSHASGLFQHLPVYWAERSAKAGWPGADIFEPYANVAVAAWLKYYDGGWSHWTCYTG